MGETLLSIGLSKEEQVKYLDVDKYVYDLRILFDNMPRTITFDDTFLNRRQGLVGKTFTTTRDEDKYISLIGENPTDEFWRTLKIFDEELYKFKISNGALRIILTCILIVQCIKKMAGFLS